MSKQREAKDRQMYVDKFIPATCSNCTHCEPVMTERLIYNDPNSWAAGTRMGLVQTSQRCGLGGFAVKKQGACNEHAGSL